MSEALLLNEQSSSQYETTLKDQAGLPIPLATLSTLTLTLSDAKTGSVINSRSAQDVKNANGGTFHATTGLFTMIFSPADSPIVTSTEAEEHHQALFQATWAGGGGVPWSVDLWVRNVALTPVAAPDLDANALLTLAEAREALKITDGTQNALLAALINSVSARWNLETGRQLKSRSYLEEYRYVESHQLRGGQWLDVEAPITALPSLLVNGTLQSTWLPGDPGSPEDAQVFVLEGARDRLYRMSGWTPGMLVQRTYTAGYGAAGFPIPGDLRDAVAMTLRHFYYVRDRQSVAVASRSTGSETVTYLNLPMPTEAGPVIRAYRRWGA